MTSEGPAGGAIQLQGLAKRFGRTWALRDVTFTLPVGAFLLMVGPNGAGKSTLVAVLGTLLRPTAGSVRVFGESVAESTHAVRRSVGVLTHEPMLYPHLTVAENLLFFGKLFALKRLEERLAAALDTFALADYAGAPVGALSHGTVQRAALARATLHRPRLLLLDEPFAGLDERGRELLRDALEQLREQGATVLMTAHQPEAVVGLADTVAVLSAGELRGYEHRARWSEADVRRFYRQCLAGPQSMGEPA